MQRALRVLMIEDTIDKAMMIIRQLKQAGFVPTWERVETASQLKKALAQKRWDMILADNDLPHFNGMDALMLVSNNGNGDLPFILISDDINDDTAVQAITIGASDFVSKNNFSRLIFAINRELNRRKIVQEHILMEKEFQERERFLSDIFNAVQEGICVLANDLNIIRVNSWIKKTYQDKMPIVGKKCYEVFQSRQSRCITCPSTKTLQKGTPHQRMLPFSPTKGKEKWIEATSYPLKNSYGETVGIILSLKDVTKRKRAEEKLLRFNKQLEHQVSIRTAQLEAANKELESFSYSVSHDLQAPLNRIDGFSQLLLNGNSRELPSEVKNYLKRIRKSVSQMTQLIDNLLLLSRVSQSEMLLSELDVSPIVCSIVDSLKEIHPQRKVEFNIQQGVVAYGDARLIRIVMENLINNAWKFTQYKSPAIIEFGMKKNRTPPVYFVRDNGAGFNMAYVDKLFTPFKRLHSDDEFPGTGIGLATVQRIIHRHGGEVWAEGEINKGATIYFTLPDKAVLWA